MLCPTALSTLSPTPYGVVSIAEANELLVNHHYLGPVRSGRYVLGHRRPNGTLDQVQVWRHPSARYVPQDWLELTRWCIVAQRRNAGSQMMGWTRKWLRQNDSSPALVSYSELGKHDGGLYKASGWEQIPTHHALRWIATEGKGYPSGHGDWGTGNKQTPKMRWVIWMRKGARRRWMKSEEKRLKQRRNRAKRKNP